MTRKQIMRVHTAVGRGDRRRPPPGTERRIRIPQRNEEIRRVKIADIVIATDPETGEEIGGIETIYSRS